MTVAPEKHVNYFALEKACAKHLCPLCTIVAERSERYIDNMLFEHVSDRGFRAKYRASGGFCAAHARSLESYRDGLAVAILGEDILTAQLPFFRKKRKPVFKGQCPACAEQQRIENEFLGFICEQREDPFIEFFMASGGLCSPHYALLLSQVKKIPEWLVSFQTAKFESLLERTRRFIEYSAWGRQDDFAALTPEDKVVWKELARVLSGSAE